MRFRGNNMSTATTPKADKRTPTKIKYGHSTPERAQIAPTPPATVMKRIRRKRIANASENGVFELLSNEASRREVSMELSDFLSVKVTLYV